MCAKVVIAFKVEQGFRDPYCTISKHPALNGSCRIGIHLRTKQRKSSRQKEWHIQKMEL